MFFRQKYQPTKKPAKYQSSPHVTGETFAAVPPIGERSGTSFSAGPQSRCGVWWVCKGARPAMQMLVASKSYCIHPLFSIYIYINSDGGSRWVIYRATGPTRSNLPVSTEALSVEFILGDRRSLPTLAQGPCFAGVGKLEVSAMVAGLGLLERISRIRDLWHGYAMFCLYGLPGVTQVTQIFAWLVI